jgi:hypothetical protein
VKSGGGREPKFSGSIEGGLGFRAATCELAPSVSPPGELDLQRNGVYSCDNRRAIPKLRSEEPCIVSWRLVRAGCVVSERLRGLAPARRHRFASVGGMPARRAGSIQGRAVVFVPSDFGNTELCGARLKLPLISPDVRAIWCALMDVVKIVRPVFRECKTRTSRR